MIQIKEPAHTAFYISNCWFDFLIPWKVTHPNAILIKVGLTCELLGNPMLSKKVLILVISLQTIFYLSQILPWKGGMS